MQDATGLQYLLTDHLGSTVAVTNSSGTLTSQQRYLPFGGTRAIPNSPILATDFGYTGQRLLDSDMGGVMDYKARFYSVYLNRFIQPDSIVQNLANPQSWNRFSYVLNNPIRYNDPSGHVVSCEAEEDCAEVRRTEKLSANEAWDEVLSKYGVKLKGDWDIRRKIALGLGVVAVANKLSEVTYLSPAEIFRKIYGGLTFTWGDCNECKGAGGYTYSNKDIRFASMAGFHHSDWLLRSTNNVIHELGHAFNAAMGFNLSGLLAHDMNRYSSSYNVLLVRNPDPNSYSGFASPNNSRVWVQNPATTASEVFADQFLGWVSNTWESDRYGLTDQGAARADWMNTNMTGFLAAYR